MWRGAKTHPVGEVTLELVATVSAPLVAPPVLPIVNLAIASSIRDDHPANIGIVVDEANAGSTSSTPIVPPLLLHNFLDLFYLPIEIDLGLPGLVSHPAGSRQDMVRVVKHRDLQSPSVKANDPAAETSLV